KLVEGAPHGGISGAADTGCHRLTESEGVADREHPVPDAHLLRLPERETLDAASIADSQQRNVARRIAGNDLCFVTMRIGGEAYDHLVRLQHRSPAGDDRTIAADREA